MQSLQLPNLSLWKVDASMKIYSEFNMDLENKDLICFIGAGGKTTTMFQLAKELRDIGKKILITTTTAIYFPSERDCDTINICESKNLEDLYNIKGGGITVIGKRVLSEGKLKGCDKEFVDEIYKRNIFDYVLVEGDGAKKKAIKAPAFYEPIIPECTTKTIGMIGLDVLGKPINEEIVHRSELFCKITDSKMNAIIDEGLLVQLITSQNGLFKDMPANSEKYLLLNKVSTKELQNLTLKIVNILREKRMKLDKVIAGEIQKKFIYGSWRIS